MVRMKFLHLKSSLVLFFCFVSLLVSGSPIQSSKPIILSCKEDNDLYRTLLDNKISCVRYNSPDQAIKHSSKGSGVMILADGYPGQPTELDPALFAISQKKGLRICKVVKKVSLEGKLLRK